MDMTKERSLEVKLKDDGTIAVLSLGGGMPVGIYLDVDEAEDVMNGLRTVLERYWRGEFESVVRNDDRS